MRCLRCNRYYQEWENKDNLCKPCSKKPFDRTRFNKKLDEVIFVLSTQGKLQNYIEEINKIKTDIKYMYKYNWYNVTEMLLQLEFNRRGWKIEYQKNDFANGFRFDFYIREFKLDIEVDEKSHSNKIQKEKDERRNKVLGKNRIVRIPEQIIRANIEKAADAPIIKIICDTKLKEDRNRLNERFKKAGINIDYKKFIEERLQTYEDVV